MNWLSNTFAAIGDFIMDNIVNPIVNLFSSTPRVKGPSTSPVRTPTTPSMPKSEIKAPVQEFKLPKVKKDTLENKVNQPEIVKKPSAPKGSKAEKSKNKVDLEKPEKKNNTTSLEKCCENICAKDKEGFLCKVGGTEVIKKHIKASEHGALKKVNAIVLHRSNDVLPLFQTSSPKYYAAV